MASVSTPTSGVAMGGNEPSRPNLKARLAEWQARVLQLDRRNGLLYLKGGRSSVRVLCDSVDLLYKELESTKNGLAFDHVQPKSKKDAEVLFAQPGEAQQEREPEYILIEGDLETEGDPRELQRRLFALQKRDREWLEEQGINVLFLAVGVLRWVDDEGVRASAPLFLCPCDLLRKSPRDPFFLTKEEEDPTHNATLQQKLRMLGVEIPDLEDELPSAYLERVRTAIRGKSEWEVREEVHLATFAYSKLAIWKDLEEMRQTGVNHPLVRCLAGDIKSLRKEQESHPSPFPAVGELAGGRLDDLIRVKNDFTVLEADYSQLIAIERARGGAHMVIHGPPGTGKSQTIANLVASLLADGKKVLFVSEKTAALDVVKRRLVECGLGVFCLDLHSERGRKANVYVQLREALEESRTRHRGDTLEQLERTRSHLNQVTRELHKVREPLGLTTYQVQGRFGLLADYPRVDFSMAGLEKFTGDHLARIEEALERVRRRPREYSEHATSRWRALKARSSSLRLASDIRDVGTAFKSASSGVSKESEASALWIGVERPRTLGEVDALSQLLSALAECRGIPSDWCAPSRRRAFRDLYGRAVPLLERKCTVETDLKGAFSGVPGPDVISESLHALSIDSRRLLACQAVLGSQWGAVVLQRHRETPERLRDLIDRLRELQEASVELHALLRSGPERDPLVGLAWAMVKSQTLSRTPVLPPQWAVPETVARVRFLANEARDRRRVLAGAEAALVREFSARLVDAVDDEMPLRFRTDYTSFWNRLFSRRYRQDTRTLAGHRTAAGRFKREMAIGVLEKVSAIKEARRAVRESISALATASHGAFDPEVADWNGLEQVLKIVESLHADDAMGREQLRAALSTSETKQRLDRARGATVDRVASLASSVVRFQRECSVSGAQEPEAPLLQGLTGLGNGTIPDGWTAADAFDSLDKAISVASAVAKVRERLGDTLVGAIGSIEALVSSLRSARELHELRGKLSEAWSTLHAELPAEFRTPSEDWAALAPAAEWLATYGAVLPSTLNDTLKVHLERPQSRETYTRAADALRSAGVRLRGAFESAALVFDILQTPVPDLPSARFDIALEWAEDLLEAPESANSWLEYLAAVRGLEELLEVGVIDRVWQVSDNPEEVPGVVLRRVYEAWLDRIYRTVPSLSEAGEDLDAHRERFRSLDQAFVKANRARVRELCFKKYPDPRLPTRGLGELGQLQTELTKKRRQRPVRWLMEHVPNVVQSLKPCLLMSPLAVSQYLPRVAGGSPGPTFDVVIFDEASQVYPEDAIPALSRATQAIVVGDEQQLPPTPFFRRHDPDDEATEDEEDGDEVSSESLMAGRESILDATVGLKGLAVEDHSLRVHYRSKHEDLIRFSNRYYYDGNLLVFPTALSSRPGLGLRDVYLPDARYDAGSTKTNRGEAEAVVKAVFDLMRERPVGESIGVVALSRAQADFIEQLFNEKRLIDRTHDERFAEARAERFFVKNLENVQGDERDHVVLCIGYGPTVGSNAVPNRFGPLNADGGHRRLNVAVTRARRSLTVVHSLRPEDIHSEQPGPRLLRRYLEYLASPAGALEAGELRPTTDEPQSPFEAAVYRALVSRGHRVFCQVGCNGYFIDLAIASDHGSGFALGIECDGEAYHSSPAARDRDWQRQRVLEGLGWHIHRIWSRSWIVDPKREVESVEAVLQRAASLNPSGNPRTTSVSAVEEPGQPYEEVEAHRETDSLFMPYRRATFSEGRARGDLGDADDSFVARQFVEVVKIEQPVHEEVVWKRLKAYFGNQRIGPIIEEKLRRVLRMAMLQGHLQFFDDSIGGETSSREFLCANGFTDVKPRGKDSSGVRTRIREISHREVAVGLETVVRASYGITAEDAMVAASRGLGFGRTGEDIRERMALTLRRLIQVKRIVKKDGKLFVT